VFGGGYFTLNTKYLSKEQEIFRKRERERRLKVPPVAHFK
jgi:hypothetical protein